jgi:lysophospholipase L1-like esterase
MSFERFIAKQTDTSREQVVTVVFGDSITEVNWHTRGHLNWVGLLQEALFERYCERYRGIVINAGRSGDTARNGLARLEIDVLRFAPDLVILSFGMNDALRPDESVETFITAMMTLVERCRATGAEVLLRTPNPVLLSPEHAMEYGLAAGAEDPERRVAPMAQATREIAARLDCTVVDHYASWLHIPVGERWPLMNDEVHPGPQGHLLFYRELAPMFGLPTHFTWETTPEA